MMVALPSMRKRYFQPGRWCLIWKTPKEMRPEKAPDRVRDTSVAEEDYSPAMVTMP